MGHNLRSGIVKSTCALCPQCCGVLAHTSNYKVTKVEGDPDRPVNKGELCAKGLASLEYLYHPARLKHPLRRAERGKGEWRQISWDEALDTIANELIKSRDNYGTESVAVIRGARRGFQNDYLARLANAFGTPNLLSAGYVCWLPREIASVITCGFNPYSDYKYPPNYIVKWGSGSLATRLGQHKRTMEALDRGTKLIVIDPRKTELANQAELWLQLKPGSDLALVLGMINVIIKEGLFDSGFIENWTVGFNELNAHVQDYTLDKVEELTWVDKSKIRLAAALYAKNKPACIETGNAIEHNIYAFQTGRAIAILRAITGNLGIPGGDIQCSLPGLLETRTPEMLLRDKIPPGMRNRRLGKDQMLPIVSWALPQLVTKATIDEKPYPVRAAYIQGSNPLLTWPGTEATHRAFKKLDFLVVADMFMTPTSALADIVLPVTSYLEYDNICESPYFPIAQVQQKVTEVGECRSDYEIINELAKRLGLEKYFWGSTEEFFNTILKPVGLTFNEFRNVGVISGVNKYRSHETNGFATASRKVELYSERLKDWGFDPLPIYRETSSTSNIDFQSGNEYPLILTSWKSAVYRHSGGRQIATLRASHPEPIVIIHPDTGSKLGIGEGDWVYIETKQGRIRQKACLTTSIDPRVVGVDYAWWFPEKQCSELYDWARSNINILTDIEPPYSREMGTPNLRGLYCKVYKT